jgi:hypothetical protein
MQKLSRTLLICTSSRREALSVRQHLPTTQIDGMWNAMALMLLPWEMSPYGGSFGHGRSEGGHRAAPSLLLVSEEVVDPLFESVQVPVTLIADNRAQ